VDRSEARLAIDALISEQRDRCLWWLRPGYLPSTDAERAWVLTELQRRSDRATFARAGELKRCLLQNSNVTSVGS